MKKNLLVTLADSNYVDQAKQLFSGAYFNAGWKGDMMLLAYRISAEELRWFKEKGILIYECDDIHIKSQMPGKWPPVVLHKFHLLKPYFKQWDTIVFLDTDIIIRSSLDALIRVREFSAVQCHSRLSAEFLGGLSIFLRNLNRNLLPEIKRNYSMRNPAFNSGMFAFPSDIIRESSFDELVGLQEKFGSISTGGEEAAFNLYFNDWKKLPEIYNVFPDLLLATTHIKPDQIQGIILHFTLHKPWVPGHAFYDEWKANYDKADGIGSIRNIGKPIEVPAISLAMHGRKSLAKLIRYYTPVFIGDLIGYTILFLQRFFPSLYQYLKKRKDARKSA
jgi:lipopolysaccharide biosynthesis glycosyltransferase